MMLEISTLLVIPMLLNMYSCRELSEEELLIDELFSDYNPTARPVIDSENTVNVSLQFSLMHIKELDIRSQVLTTTGLLIFEWRDERLVWTPEEYGNMFELIVEADKLWRPEFAVINGAEKIYESYNNFRAIITHKGMIRWEPGGVFKTICQINIRLYPFDHQACELHFGAWSYHTNKMNLTNPATVINMDSYKSNGEWHMRGTEARRTEFAYLCCPNERYSSIAFVVHISRRHNFYIFNIILPSVMTSVLLLSIFYCTPAQKVQIGVVVLLSFRIFLLNVADNIPKTSDHIPILGIYLTCTMAITTLSMILTVAVLNIHSISERPVPGWVRRVFLTWLAFLDCRAPLCTKKPQSLQQQRSNNTSLRRAAFFYNKNTPENGTVLEIRSGSNARDTGVDDDATEVAMETTPLNHGYHAPTVAERTRTFSSASAQSKCKDDYAHEWRKVADVIDRLFFWVFFIAILVSTVIVFMPLFADVHPPVSPMITD